MIIKNKTGRKNNTNIKISYPEKPFFTYPDMFAHNPKIVQITLRVKVKADLDKGIIKEIGIRHNNQGRPTNVFAVVPVSPETLKLAREANIALHTQYSPVPVMNVRTQPAPRPVVTPQLNIKIGMPAYK
jgi:hypothetical protein